MADEYMAAPGTKDDAVCAWLLAVLSAVDATSGILEVVAEAPQPVKYAKPWAVHDVAADLGGQGNQPSWLEPW